jgi:quinol monooxygenase YgiN
MIALVVDCRIAPAHVDAFDAEIKAYARTSRETERGCRQFDVCRDPADPTLFFLYELYDDEAAVEAHLRAPHYLHMDTATASWVQSKLVRRYVRTAGCPTDSMHEDFRARRPGP